MGGVSKLAPGDVHSPRTTNGLKIFWLISHALASLFIYVMPLLV
jgi:hypothetical protein